VRQNVHLAADPYSATYQHARRVSLIAVNVCQPAPAVRLFAIDARERAPPASLPAIDVSESAGAPRDLARTLERFWLPTHSFDATVRGRQ
jgi:hypothetical protein